MGKKYLLSALLVVTFSFLAANHASAAVTGTSTPMSPNSVNTLRADAQYPVLDLNLTRTSTENLDSVTVGISTTTNASPTALATSSFSFVGVAKDMNGNNVYDPGTDVMLATTTVAGIGTSTTISISTTTPATGAFFVVLGTNGTSTFTDNGYPETGGAVQQGFVVTISTSTGVIASSTDASLVGATTTAAFSADIHSQTPIPSDVSANYGWGTYSISYANGSHAGEAGVLNVYATSSPGASPLATGSWSGTGTTTIALGSTYYPSVWLDANDAAGNATSSKAQYNLSSNTPTVTSFTALTDRIIVNASKGLRGDEATNCSNYQLNGSTLSCGGSSSAPFINFNGNQFTIMNLNLSTPVSFSIAANTIQDAEPDQFPLNFATSGVSVQTGSVPYISSISPGSGKAGDSVTLTGTDFGTATGTVYFSGGYDPSTGPKPPVEASITAWNSNGTSATVTVPTGAQSGPVQVTSSSGIASDVGQNTFFGILGNIYVKLDLATSTSAITTSTNMRITVGVNNGENIYYDGDSSGTTFNSSTDVYTIPNVPSQGFVWAYDASGADLPSPGMMLQPNTSSSSPQMLVLASSTSYKVSGTITLDAASCGITKYENQQVAAMAMPLGQNIETGSGGVQPAFFTTNGSCQSTYAVALPGTGSYDIEAHLPPSSTATGLLDPAGQTAVISDSTTTATLNFTFTAASNSIYGQVVGGDGNPLPSDKYSNLWVFAYQPVVGGQGAVAQPNSSGYFRLYATPGAYKLSVGGPGMPNSTEQDLLVTTSTAFSATASTPVVTIKLAPPTSYIDGYVKDSSGNAVSSVDVFSYCSNGPGGGHSSTDSQGYYKMYVSPCSSYTVNGFSSTYGQLIAQTSVAVSDSGSATVNFTINSSNFVTISGSVSKNSSPVSGANIWITEGDFGQGIAGGQTDTNGNFSLQVQSGLSNLYVHAAVSGQGQLASLQLNSGNPVTSNQTGLSLSSDVATLNIVLKPGNTFSQAFLSANSDIGSSFTNTLVSTSTDHDIYQMQVPYSGGGTLYTINGGIPNFGPIPTATTTISGNSTTTIDLTALNFYTVSGTVSGDYNSAYVWAAGSNGGGTQVSSDGTFSMQLRQGTYDIGVNKPGYIGTFLAQQDISTTTSGLVLSLAQSSSTISGTAYYNGSALSGANVWADNSSGGWAGTQTDANGAFSLSVTPGNWQVHAIDDGYQLSSPLVVTAPASSVALNLTAVSFQPTQLLQSVNPTQGGTLQSTSTELQVPQGALGSGSTNVQLSITNTMNAPDTLGAKVIGTAEDISASYASGSNQGQAVTTLSQNATINMIVTKAELIAGGITTLAAAENMQIGYYDTTSNSWTYLPTTVTASSSDGTWGTLTSITLAGTTSHFSTYAPVSPTSAKAPSTPSGVTATESDNEVTLAWTAVSGATEYDIYKKSGSNYAYLAQTSATSYSDIDLTNGTTYSYEVSALDVDSNESAASAAVSATPTAPATNSTGGGGGGSVAYVPPSPTATTTATAATSSVTAASPVTIVPPATISSPAAISAILSVTLRIGNSGEDVTRLQQLLAQDPSIYPEGKITGYFGPLTEQAVERFQKKYDLVSSGTPVTTGYGIVGPKTRAKLAEVFGTAATATPPSTPQSSLGASTVQATQQKIAELQQELLVLLQQLVLLLKK